MFDSVRNNKKIVQIFLALIALPFAFFGIDSYVRNSGVGNDLANVGDTKITLQQFDQALRERQDQMRQALGENFRVDMLNTPQERMSILNSLVDQRLLMLEASRLRITTSDTALREVISRIPSLQEDGKFSMSRYEAALRNQGISQPQFEAKLRQDLTMQQLIGAVSDTAFVSAAQAEAMLRLQSEEREYGEFRVAAEQFSSKVAIDAATVQKYYEDNRNQFEVAEKLRADYLVLSLDALLAQTKASEADVKSWYDSHKDRYQQAEERRASHILVLAKSDSDKGKAKIRAEELLKEVQKAPARFAELAKQHSQDPGSATKGGDLGFFGRGMMVKAFEDAVFNQKEGEVSGVVESEFGFHIIKLTGIKAGRLRPLDEVRAEIETEVKRQTASRKYAEVAESFTNTVYEQSESLQPAAEKFGLKVQSSGWLAKNPDPREAVQPGPLANEKIRSLLFLDDAVKNKRNTEAVEVSPNTLVAARVVEFVPASIKPFDTVKIDIEKKLKAQEMAAMAKAAGDARLAELKRGEDKISWSSPKRVSRMQSQQLPLETVKALFKADAEKLPAYAGASVDGSFVLYKISKITRPEKIDAEMLKGFQTELGSIAAREDLSAYFTALRSRYKIEINKSQLESRERP